MTRRLIFVYNADSGLFNALADWAHKIFSPETYACGLCAVTYHHLGRRREWKQFVQALGLPVEFLHRDELRQRYGIAGVPLPAVFVHEDTGVRLWLDAEAVNACHTLEELMTLVITRRERIESSD
jgi:hypothetical protein